MSSENAFDINVIYKNLGTKLILGNKAKKRHSLLEGSKLLQTIQSVCLACVSWCIQQALSVHHLTTLSLPPAFVLDICT